MLESSAVHRHGRYLNAAWDAESKRCVREDKENLLARGPVKQIFSGPEIELPEEKNEELFGVAVVLFGVGK